MTTTNDTRTEAQRYLDHVTGALADLYTLATADDSDFDELVDLAHECEEAGEAAEMQGYDAADVAAEHWTAGLPSLSDSARYLARVVTEHEPDFDFSISDVDELREAGRERLYDYFLEFSTATPMAAGEFDAGQTCVKAVITVGGPYAAIHQFFGQSPVLVYRSWGDSLELPLRGDALSAYGYVLDCVLGC